MTDDQNVLRQLSSEIWGWVLFRGITLTVLGILLIRKPGITVAVMVMFLGAGWLVDGVFTIVESIRGRKHLENWGLGLFVGLISAFAGLVVFSRPLASALLTTTFLVYVLAFAAIVSGMLSVVTGIRLRKEITNEWSMILGGLLYGVFGLLLLARPLVSVVTLVWIFGILALAGGFTFVMVALKLRKVGQEGLTP